MIEYNLSLSDLSLIKGFDILFNRAVQGEEYFHENKTGEVVCAHHEVLDVLYRNGMDTSKEVTIRSCKHRNLRGETVNTFRFDGLERVDLEWVECGAASFNAKVYHSAEDDSSYKRDILEMGWRGGVDSGII